MTSRVIVRAAGHAAVLAGCLVAGQMYFGGSEVAVLSLFTLGAFIFELSWPARTGGRTIATAAGLSGRWTVTRDGWQRAFLYMACLAGLAGSGTYLLKESMRVRHDSQVKERLTGAMNEAEETVALATNDSNVMVAVTGGLLRRTGYSREELLGKPVTVLVPDFDLAQTLRDAESLRDHCHRGFILRESRRLRFRTSSGRPLDIKMSVVAVRMSADSLSGRDVLILMLAELGS